MQKHKFNTFIAKFRAKTLLGAGVALVMTANIFSTTQASSAANLVLHYDFEDANNLGKDLSAKANHGTNHGVTQIEGKLGKGAEFHQQGDSIEIPLSASFSDIENQISISAWVKLKEYPTGEAGKTTNSIFMRPGAYYSAICRTKNALCSYRYGRAQENTTHRYIEDDQQFPLNTWVHTTVVYDTSHTHLYINGQKVHSIANQKIGPRLGVATTHNAFVGGGKDGVYPLKGEIDELKVRNTAISDEQVQAEYQRAQPTLTLLFIDQQGNELGTQTLTHTSNGDDFRYGKTYQVTPPALANPDLRNRYTLLDEAQTITFTAGTQAQATFRYSPNELILHYTFDEANPNSTKDLSEKAKRDPNKANHAIAHNAPLAHNDRGRVGGTYQRPAFKASKSLEIGNHPTFSIGSWVKTTSSQGQAYFIGNAVSGNGYRFGLSGGKVAFLVGNTVRGPQNGYQETTCSTATINDGKWHHIMGVFDLRGQKVTCYIDGVKAGEHALPEYYKNRHDSAPRIGAVPTQDGWASFWEKINDGQLDDLRVFNYALTPDQIRQLYNSYPPAGADPAFKLEFTSSKTGNIFTNQQITLNTTLNLYRATKNLTLQLTLPNQFYINNQSFPDLNGSSPISGTITNSRGLTGTTYFIPLKDEITGIINGTFQVNIYKQTIHDSQFPVILELIKGNALLESQTIQHHVWNKMRLLTQWVSPEASTYGNGFPLKFNIRKHKEASSPEAPNNYYYTDNSAPIFNVSGYLPLPPQAKFVSSEDPAITYDANRHALKLNSRTFTTAIRHNTFNPVFLQFEGLKVGDTVTFPEGRLYGHAGDPSGPIQETIVPSFSKIVEAPTHKLEARHHTPQGSIIINHPQQQILGFGVRNNGNTLLRNVEIETNIPDGIKVYDIRRPVANENDGNGTTTHIRHPFGVRYTTTLGRELNIPPAREPRNLSAAALGLQNGEYLKKIIFYTPELAPHTSVGAGGGAKWNGMRIFGDVQANYADGSPLQNEQNIVFNGEVRAEGIAPKQFSYTHHLTNLSYAPTHIHNTLDKWVVSQGDMIRINGHVEVFSSWHYNNGHMIKNPSLFLMIPNAIKLDPSSFRAQMTDQGTFSAPRIVTNVVNPPADHTIWRVDFQTELENAITAGIYKHKFLTFQLNLLVPNDAIPGELTLHDKIRFGADNPNFQVRGAWGVHSVEDPYQLWGPSSRRNRIVTNHYSDQTHRKNITIVANKFGTNTTTRANKDDTNKSTFDKDNLSSRSNYTSNGTGIFTARLYNGSSTPIKNIDYLIQLPMQGRISKSDLKINERSPTLSKAVETANLPSGTTISYSADGQTFAAGYNSNAKFIRIQIPSLSGGLASHLIPTFTVHLQAHSFDNNEARKEAFITTSYSINGNAQKFEGITAGIRTVPTNFTPDQDAKYKFCNTTAVKTKNAGISVPECQALIDFFLENGGLQRKKATERKNAATVGRSTTEYTSIPAICDRSEIDCDNTGKLTELHLNGKGIKNQIPNSFANLKNLTILDLSDNPGLAGDIPTAFNGLTALRNLNLSKTSYKNFNNLAGQLENLNLSELANTEADFQSIPPLPRLKTLNLSNTQWKSSLTDGFFNKIRQIETLEISNAKLKGNIPSNLNTLTMLEVLNLSNNHLTGSIPNFSSLTNLVSFNISQNYISGPFPDVTEKFSALKSFDISDNYIAGLGDNSINFTQFTNANSIARSSINNYQQWQLVLTDNGRSIPNNTLTNVALNSPKTLTLKKQRIQGKNKGQTTELESSFPQTALKATYNSEQISVNNPNTKTPILTLIKGQNADFSIGFASDKGATATVTLKPRPDQLDPNAVTTGATYSNTGTTKNNAQGLEKGLEFDLKGAFLAERFSTVHFSVGGNDFGGGFFWNSSLDLENPVILSINNQRIQCHSQLRGFYYNSQRGERIWPLDIASANSLKKLDNSQYNGLQMTGGLYTKCQPDGNDKIKLDENQLGIYGNITHTDNKGRTFRLYAGVDYQINQNSLKSSGYQSFKCNLQLLNNSYPFGYIYDESGGVGLIGANIQNGKIKDHYKDVHDFHENFYSQLENGKCINEIFDHDGVDIRYKDGSITGFPTINNLSSILQFGYGNAKTIFLKLGIRGIIGLSLEVAESEKTKIDGNNRETSLLLSTDNSISSIINHARKHAEELCRGKWTNQVPSSLASHLVCLENKNNNSAHFELDRDQYKNKTIIVKDADLKLIEYMANTDETTTIFIDRGNLLIPAEGDTGNLQTFSANGYIISDSNSSDPNETIKANFLKGNFIINGLLLGIRNDDYAQITNKLIIHGKMASFNTINKIDEGQKDAILAKITGNNFSPTVKKYISLEELFGWTCDEVSGKGSDGTSCVGQTTQGSSFLTDKAFGLIDMYFASPLFK